MIFMLAKFYAIIATVLLVILYTILIYSVSTIIARWLGYLSAQFYFARKVKFIKLLTEQEAELKAEKEKKEE